MEITLDSVIGAARLRRAAVTGEVAGYVALLTLQRVATAPCAIGPESIFLTDAGDILVRPLGFATAHELEATLRGLLAALVALCPSAAPAIKSAAERSSGGGLLALESELLTALVPINHAASRRALARLYRETQRADRASSLAVSGPGETLSALDGGGPITSTPLPATSLTPEAARVTGAPLPSAPSVGIPPLGVELRDLDIDVDVEAEVVTHDFDGSLELAHQNAPVTELDLDAAMAGARIKLEAIAARHELLPDLAAEAAAPSASDEADFDSGSRSDLRELLASFLSHTRCEERMARELRRMIGVDPGAVNRVGATDAVRPDN